ncbi:MAG TPA: class I adenylate-forming enzyme family protein [Frankiaceae bacterium]|jgi:acyl-CoA synthetase (AMP-forming)/AMP-acid ligase II|nr:class I adenylate-forming enzyme family protein [Frankiaceae bacterium]
MTNAHEAAVSGYDVYSADPRLQPLLGPGGPFELEDIVLEGVPLKSFARAPRTIVDMFQGAKAHADLDHIVFEDERLTFADVRRKALGVAQHLKTEYGVGPGDRVAIAMRNFPEFVCGFWSAAVLGAIVVPLNAWWTGPELQYALVDCGARVVFADPERVERLQSVASSVPVIGVRGVEGPAVAAFEELAGGPGLDEAEFAALGPDDPVTILYTSGTTGHPKGALGTNRATIANLMNMGFGFAREMILSGRKPGPPVQAAAIGSGPLFHIGGIAGIVGGAMSGSKMVLMRKRGTAAALELAVRERVTSLGGVPAVAQEILDFPGIEKIDLQIRSFPMGGAPVPPRLPRRVREVFGESVQMFNGYGGTETTSAVVTNVGAEYDAHPDSVGRPNLTAQLRVLGPDGAGMAFGEVGELAFRSPQVVKGYWNNPSATKESFADGWFRTGDLGYVDADGFVYVVDRLKDVVIRGGENVYCAEVEAVLVDHPGIEDVAVIGLADDAMGERVCAVVVARAGAAVTLADLRTFASARLAAFKCPEALWLTDELPRTATDKVSKGELRGRVPQSDPRFERTY